VDEPTIDRSEIRFSYSNDGVRGHIAAYGVADEMEWLKAVFVKATGTQQVPFMLPEPEQYINLALVRDFLITELGYVKPKAYTHALSMVEMWLKHFCDLHGLDAHCGNCNLHRRDCRCKAYGMFDNDKPDRWLLLQRGTGRWRISKWGLVRHIDLVKSGTVAFPKQIALRTLLYAEYIKNSVPLS
jgi:hypothetical protein